MATKLKNAVKNTYEVPNLPNNNSEPAVTEQQDKSQERIMAELGLSSVAVNANTARQFARGAFGGLDLGESVGVMCGKVSKVQMGDLTGVEATLTAQAATLDAVFNELARRAAMSMSGHLTATEVYLRLALKAQSQCRATLQTLAEIKNPLPVAFVRQANIAAGPQQVNFGMQANGEIRARAENSVIQPNELLEASNGERLDTETTSAAGGAYSQLETLGALHRSKD